LWQCAVYEILFFGKEYPTSTRVNHPWIGYGIIVLTALRAIVTASSTIFRNIKNHCITVITTRNLKLYGI